MPRKVTSAGLAFSPHIPFHLQHESGARDEGEGVGAADHEGQREHQGEHGPRVEEPRVHRGDVRADVPQDAPYPGMENKPWN